MHWLRALFPGAPSVLAAQAVRNPAGADLSMDAELRFPDGTIATVRASMAEDVPLRSALTVEATRGTLVVENMVFPSSGHSIDLELDGIPYGFTVAGRHTYDHQLEAVLTALRHGTALPTEGADPVENMAVIDAIYAAAGFDRGWN